MKKKLLEKFATLKYPVRVAESLSEELLAIDKRLIPLCDAWLDDDETRDYAVDKEYSVLGLVKKTGMEYHAALLSIDWLLKDPVVARKVIENGID